MYVHTHAKEMYQHALTVTSLLTRDCMKMAVLINTKQSDELITLATQVIGMEESKTDGVGKRWEGQ